MKESEIIVMMFIYVLRSLPERLYGSYWHVAGMDVIVMVCFIASLAVGGIFDEWWV